LAVVAGTLLAPVLTGQAAGGQGVLRIYVEPFANRGGALHDEVVKLLRHQKAIVVVANPSEADRVLAGRGETHVRGYLARNPRVRYLNNDSRAIYGGFLSVEFKNTSDETLWSYLVTPRRFGSEDINQNLAEQIVAKLLQFIANP
jgi:hypothetical protein